MSAEYGWTDETILDLPVGRFRQVSEAISVRREVDDRITRIYLEWQTKTLASFIGATIPMEKKHQKNPLVEAAQQLTLFPETIQKKKEPAPGSFEAAQRLFGGGGPS